MEPAGSPIRSKQRVAATIAAAIFGPLFMGGPLAFGVLLLVQTRFSALSWVLFLAGLGGSVFLAYHILQSYHWVELDGDTLRARRFWTRQSIERSVHDIDAIVPLVAVAKTPHTAIADKLLGPIRGYEVRFKNGGRTITLIRGDMTNVQELADALAARRTMPDATAGIG